MSRCSSAAAMVQPEWSATATPALTGAPPEWQRPALRALRAGNCTVVVDNATGGGVLVAAAVGISAATVNQIALIAKGLVMMAITEERAERLGLALQPRRHAAAQTPVFTVSIEAAQGVSTGISAADRAHTLRTASAHFAEPAHLVSPGHIFPVVAASGWRGAPIDAAGQALNLVHRARGEDVAVFAQILDNDGEILRADRLARFSLEHGVAMIPASTLLRS